MTVRPTFYYLTSFLAAMVSCVGFVFSAFQLYGDDDYVYNYLRCGPNGDSVAIPIIGSIMVSMFFFAVHIVVHLTFIRVTWTKSADKDFKIRLGFYRDEKVVIWITKLAFYLFAVFLVYDYARSFYKFYFFEFLSCIAMITTVLFYSITISNLFGTKKQQVDIKPDND